MRTKWRKWKRAQIIRGEVAATTGTEESINEQDCKSLYIYSCWSDPVKALLGDRHFVRASCAKMTLTKKDQEKSIHSLENRITGAVFSIGCPDTFC